MDTALKAIGGYTAAAAFVALVTGESGFDGKFSNALWILVGMYTAVVPTMLIFAGIAALAEHYGTKLPDVTNNQAAFVLGVSIFGLGLVSRYVWLDASTRHPTHAAAVAGAVLLAVPFVIIGFRTLGTHPTEGKAATPGGAHPAVPSQPPQTAQAVADEPPETSDAVTAPPRQTFQAVVTDRTEQCPVCRQRSRIHQPGTLTCAYCGSRFEALPGGGVRREV